MIFSNSDVRRQDRLLDENAARMLLQNGEYGILSLCCEDSEIYGLPINYAWDGKESVYLHCAQEGRKLRCIDENPNVSFCVVGRTQVISDKFTTEYESVILSCFATRNLLQDIKMKALTLLLDKYSPMDKATGIRYAENSLDQTEIIRLEIKHWSGKCKRMKSLDKQ